MRPTVVANVDLYIARGWDYLSPTITWYSSNGANPPVLTLVDMTAATARLGIRLTPDVTITPLLALTLGAGVNLGNGIISIAVTKAQSLALPYGDLYYDLFVDFTASGLSTKVLCGMVHLDP